MDIAKIHWNERIYTLDQVDKIDESNDFYVILGALKDNEKWSNLALLYIGMTYRQTVKTRIMQPHQAYDCIQEYKKHNPNKGIIIMVGAIVECSVERITEQFVTDVECCLINSNKPWCNEPCKNSYTGRDLKVINTGDYKPLKEKSICC